MKKAIIFLALCLCVLAGCGGEKSVSGRVEEVYTDTESEYAPFIIRDSRSDDKIGIVINSETYISSRVEIDKEEFIKGDFTGAEMTVELGESVGRLDNKVKAYIAESIEVKAVICRNVLELSDGTAVDMRDGPFDIIYQLSDGTELLRVQAQNSPENVYVVGKESFDDLSEEAKPKVLEFYAEQGLLYGVERGVEMAYQAYQSSGEAFQAFYFSQEVGPTASNERLMYFITYALIPDDKGNSQELRLGAAFDRETGEHISDWELFSCSEEEAKKALLNIAQISDSGLRAEMDSALLPEYIIFHPDHMEICFPVGTLPSQEYSYVLALEYDENLRSVLHDWAIPVEMAG